MLASFLVDTATDVVDSGDGQTSLREAIEMANQSVGQDFVVFDADVFAQPKTIDLVLGQLMLSDSTVVSGPTSGVTLQAGPDSRVLFVETNSGDVTIQNAVFRGGSIATTNAGGGAVLSLTDGTLRLEQVTFFDNHSDGARAGGGALTATGSVELIGSLVTGNSTSGSDSPGGGLTVGGTLALIDSEVSGNSTTGDRSRGGGIFVSSSFLSSNSDVLDNQTTGFRSDGGGLFSGGSTSINDSRFSGNQTKGEDADGGGLSSTAPVFIGGSGFDLNETFGDFSAGGAIAVSDTTLTLDSSSLTANRTSGSTGHGGAILSVRGDVSIVNSTLDGNETRGASSDGGAVASFFGDVLSIGSTVTSNVASGVGGGISFVDDQDKSLTIRNSILGMNVDSGVAPDFLAPTAFGFLDVASSLIGDNKGTALDESQVPDSMGNLVGDASGGGIIDPLLGPLHFDGVRFLRPLLEASPAIDAGDNSQVANTFDGRGEPFSRVVGGTVDMGAFERQAADPSRLIVTTLVDELDFGNQQISLREAIRFANGAPGQDTVTFGDFGEPISVDLLLGELKVADSLQVDSGLSLATIDAGGTSRVIDLLPSAGDVTLIGLSLTGGQTVLGRFDSATRDGAGGAIRYRADGVLKIHRSVISDNQTWGVGAIGGGISVTHPNAVVEIVGTELQNNQTAGAGAAGGAISTAGDTDIIESRISGNVTLGNSAGGGAVYASSGSLFLDLTRVSDNRTVGTHSSGGGVLLEPEANLVIVDGWLSANHAAGINSSGGAVRASLANFDRVTVSDNRSSLGGGGVHVDDLAMVNSTVSGNQSDGDGGGILTRHATIDFGTISKNVSASIGGGIATDDGTDAMLDISNSIVAVNADGGTSPDLKTSNDNTTLSFSLLGDNRGTGIAESQVPDADGNLVGDSVGSGVIDPGLESLRSGGGFGPTHPLIVGSSAIGRGSLMTSPVSDGRGVPFSRVAMGRSDMGAFELQSLGVEQFVVTTLADNVESDEFTSLREAIRAANGSQGVDLIRFDPSLFDQPAVISLELGEIEITDALMIEGPGDDLLSIDAGGKSRVVHFSQSSGDLLIRAMTLTGGQANGSGGGILFRSGHTLTLSNVSLLSNAATGDGGGVHAQGKVTIDAGMITGNTAGGSGGGVSALDVQVGSSVISSNATTGDSSDGGGIHSQTAMINDSLIAGNRTHGMSSGGGGLAVVSAELEQVIVSGNRADQGVGGGISSTQSLTLNSSTVSENFSGIDGGGIHSVGDQTGGLILNASGVVLNEVARDAARGGGVFADGFTRLTDSTISGNTASGAMTDGGGIYSLSGALEIFRSTVVGNTATRVGGGVLVPFATTSPLTIQCSILAANADSGIAPNFRALQDPAQLTVGFSLIDDNTGTTLAESPTPDASGNIIGQPSGGGIVDPLLGPLTEINGASVHPLMDGSPAIDRGESVADQPFDQRGDPFSRLFGSRLDMGAFEQQPPAEPTIDWEDPAPILVGTRLGANQLNASAFPAGSFDYNPGAGTLLDVGDGQPLQVDFTPDDTTYFLPVSTMVSIDVREPFDFGDAPESFGTSLSSDGPRHAKSSLKLGAQIDFEIDGEPSPRGSGDGVDEDGVIPISSFVAQAGDASTASLLVNASARAKLDAWIDFNGNGVFDHATEHLGGGVSIDLSRGDNILSITLPAGTVPGSAMARFRISSAGDLLPTGAADDGEVEDHEIVIFDGAVGPIVDVTLPRGTATLTVESGALVVRRGDDVLFGALPDSVSRFELIGTAFSDVFVIDGTQGNPFPSFGVEYDGDGLVNTLRVVGPIDTLEITETGLLNLAQVDVIDVSDVSATEITLDAVSARAMDPGGGGIIVTGSNDDSIRFADPVSWRMTDPISIVGFSFSNVTTIGTFVQLDFVSPWQNLVQNGDVNNDGDVTAGDALRIINELGRRAFSDAATSVLRDPADVGIWPNLYFDQNGDGKATALDALRVINELSRISDAASGESIAYPFGFDSDDRDQSVDEILSDPRFLSSLF